MKKIWDKFTDKLGKTIIHPQYFLKHFEYQAVLEAKKYAKEGILVDIGCGRQPYKEDLLPYVKKYIGIDHPRVSKKYNAEIRPDILADATDIPLPNNYSDITLLISVLEHLPDPKLALKEAYRITKKGGILILITVQNYILHDPPFDYYRYTKFGLKNLIEKAGYKIVNIRPLGNYVALFGQYFNVYLLYKIKELFHSKKGYLKLLAIFFLPLVFLITFVSNITVWVLLKFTGKKNEGTFALYNLAIAKK